MDITQHPGFADTYVGIRRSFGEEWAGRFALAAPLMQGDPGSALSLSFLAGLEAQGEGRHEASLAAWTRCRELMDGLATSLVSEAEALLADA